MMMSVLGSSKAAEKPKDIEFINSRRGNQARESNWTTRLDEKVQEFRRLLGFTTSVRTQGLHGYRPYEEEGSKRERNVSFQPDLEGAVAKKLGADPKDFHLRPATLEDVIDAAFQTEETLRPTVEKLESRIVDLEEQLAELHNKTAA